MSRDFRSAIDWPDFRDVAIEGDAAAMKPLSAAPIVTIAAQTPALQGMCESPIELRFGAFVAGRLAVRGDPHFVILTDQDEWAPTDSIVMIPQFRWMRWRMDWAFQRGGKLLAFVECDGKEFHSTPEQLANDRAKDDAALSTGIPLLRFSGSEIHVDPNECYCRLLEVIMPDECNKDA